MTPSSFLFTTTTVMGTLIALSSTNWLYLWMGMELNLLSFIPLIASSSSLQETEASVKYFIIQAIGSGLMLTAGIMSTNPLLNDKLAPIITMIFILSMAIKLGMAPFHQWLPHVMSSIPWILCLMLATWQKVSPMIMLIIISPQESSIPIMLIAMLSALVGGIGGLNQAQLRALLAYSSIGHMGWITATTFCSMNLFLLYFSSYILISVSLMSLFIKKNTISSSFSSTLATMSPMMFMMTMLIMFSLGGLPPFLGFVPKWMIINMLATKEMFMMVMILITGSLINLFYYFSMTFNFILLKTQNTNSGSLTLPPIILTLLCTMTPLIMPI